jgi:hypothetical protein
VVDSSIKFAALGENLVKQGGPQLFAAVNMSARGNEHVLGENQTTQAEVRPLHTASRLFAAVADDDPQIEAAVFIGRAPGVGAEPIDCFRLKLGLQSLDGFFQQTLRNFLHGFQPNIKPWPGEAGVSAIVFPLRGTGILSHQRVNSSSGNVAALRIRACALHLDNAGIEVALQGGLRDPTPLH